jgi:2-dehydropantoate 2-reductase
VVARGRAADVVIGRTCVVGAGAIGSLYAAHLASVAESSVLTRRPEHASALNEYGLRVSGRHEFTAHITAAADPDDLPEPELVIVATKTTGLDSAAAALAGRWPSALVTTVQNGLGAEEVVRRHGDWQLLSGVTFMSGTKHSDTHVEYILDTQTWLGPYGETPYRRADEVAALLVAAGLRAEARPDLRPAQWSKLIFNATVNGVAALTGLPHDRHFAETDGLADLGRFVRALVDEGRSIAAAAGVALDEDPWEMNVLATKRGSAHYPSMLEDVAAGRPTEADLINGALVREAERGGVPAPLQAALYALVKGREAAYS